MSKVKITQIKKAGLVAFAEATTLAAVDAAEIEYLGRKSDFNAILKGLKNLSVEERRSIGPLANAAKQELLAAAVAVRTRLEESAIDWETERIDVTLPSAVGLIGSMSAVRKKKGKGLLTEAYAKAGHLHPLTLIERDIEDIFTSMGFGVADGPEVETEFYNFDALNVPVDHPARDMQDTFWIKTAPGEERLVLRTQTSAVQVRYMQTHTPPFRIIIPGRVFRSEATDATHEHTFYQFECLMVGDAVTVANFKYVAEEFFSRFFGEETPIRLRPSFFPFVEPGFEFDIRCTLCHGVGCSACKHAGWIELGGAGMVHQKVFEAAGYERDRYQGFAWGFGLTRLAMMKYKIPDNRLFMGADTRFLSQF